jgi:DNA repair exonuclease SbcCD ATPase subunit
MGQILDCDKKAIDQAVFLSQGHLADFLMGTPTQREEDFARMCLIDHLSLVSDVAMQEIQRLQKTVTDLTSQRDEALLSKEQTEHALRLSEGELELHPDRTAAINWLQGHIECLNKRNEAEEQSQFRLATLQAARERLASVSCPRFSTSETAEADLEHFQNKFNLASQAQAKLGALRQNWDQQVFDQGQLERLKVSLRDVMQRASTMLPLNNELESVQKSIRSIREYQELLARYNAWQGRKSACENSIAAGEAEIAKLPEEQSVRAQLAQAQEDLLKQANVRFRLDLAKQATSHVSGCCPLCLGTDLSQLPTGDDLANLIADERSATTRIQDIIRESEAALSTRLKYQTRLGSLRTQLSEIMESSEPVWEGEAPDVTQLELLESRRQQLESTLGALKNELQNVASINADIARLETKLSNVIAQQEYENQLNSLTGLANEIPDLTQSVSSLKAYLQSRSTLQQAVTVADEQLKTARELIHQAALVQEQSWRMKHVDVLIQEERHISEFHDALAQLRGRQAERDRVQGMIRANTDALRRAENRVMEIEERARKNAATMSVIGYLEDLKNAFSRHGIPRHYLTKVFDSLITMTQEGLSEWDTDFQVEKDPETLFNFLFYRTDDPDTMLDQSQLSGGQRTRLALSFVQAVQRLLYPGLDFLCVDEPSNHLDAEGVEGLVRLFQTIAAQNEDGEAQVIVVDHNPLLHRAFSKSATLSRLKN